MKSNLEEDNKDPTFEEILHLAISEGISIAITRFIDMHKIDVSPTPACEKPEIAFVMLLTAEKHGDVEYPFEESFEKERNDTVSEAAFLLNLFRENKDQHHLRAFGRTLGACAVLNFLHRNKDHVTSIISAIRSGS